MKERSRLTAATAELGDMGRWRVDIAGALVSPLISAPRLELVLRGLAIVIYMVFSVAGFQSSLGLCVTHVFLRVREVRMCLDLSNVAWHGVRGNNSALSDKSARVCGSHILDHAQMA